MSIVDSKGNKVSRKTSAPISPEAAMERSIAYIIKNLLPPNYDCTVILRHRDGRDHVVYTKDSLADVMKAVVELQEDYPAKENIQ